MGKYIVLRFEGDNSLIEDEKRAYSRYVNETLEDLKDDIFINKAYIKVTCKNGFMLHVNLVSDNEVLNKQVNTALAGKPFKYHNVLVSVYDGTAQMVK